MYREDFKSKLDEYGLDGILDKCFYRHPSFTNEDRLFKELDTIVVNNSRVLIYGDSDADGVFAGKIIQETLKKLGCTNVEYYSYRVRSHVLTDDAVMYSIYGKYDYIIILDSSTNDLYNINRLCKFKVKPIIIDHHEPKYTLDDYNKDSIVINSMIENRILNRDEFRLSGGALTFCLCAKYLDSKAIEYSNLSAYALITLYSDCIDMSKPLNRAIYYMATELPKNRLPVYVQHFMESYSVFTRRFIEYTFVPKINALFRAERLDLINKYLLEQNTFLDYSKIVKEIKEVHKTSREAVNILTDVIPKKNMNNLVLANINSVNVAVKLDNLYNYTGLVANNISMEYGKPCIVVCDTGNYIKGSFRDLYSRNYLPIFRQFSDSNGHGAAFAINIPYITYNNFLNYVGKIDKKFSILKVNHPIAVEIYGEPDEKLVNDLALYNEFSGVLAPVAVLQKKNDMICRKSYNTSYPYRYTWGDFTIESSYKLVQGRKIKVKPVRTHTIRLITYNKKVVV